MRKEGDEETDPKYSDYAKVQTPLILPVRPPLIKDR
jgi:hypothetical protein